MSVSNESVLENTQTHSQHMLSEVLLKIYAVLTELQSAVSKLITSY